MITPHGAGSYYGPFNQSVFFSTGRNKNIHAQIISRRGWGLGTVMGSQVDQPIPPDLDASKKGL